MNMSLDHSGEKSRGRRRILGPRSLHLQVQVTRRRVMTPARPAGSLAVVVPMSSAGPSAVPEGAFTEGLPSLEVRWIFPGQLDTAVAGWFSGFQPEAESREDAYLLDPGLGGLSVKVRAGRALEVKMFLGSPGILELPGRARGRMQYWRKWSFPFSPLSLDTVDPGGWRRVRKQRQVIWFSPAGERIARAPAVPAQSGPSARCAAEITELRLPHQGLGHQEWWSLGLEATGPADSLRHGLEATAALVITQALPGGADLRIDDSRSYADWLRSR
jgi:hypothetical protein